MKSSNLTALICGLISIISTVLIYILCYEGIFEVTMRWVTLLFLIITESVLALKACINKTIITQVSIVSGCVHFASVVILSIAFVNLFPDSVLTYVLLNLLLLCALAIFDLFIFYFGKNTSMENKRLADSRAVMDSCFAEASRLELSYRDSSYGKDLKDIVELIKYSDNSTLTGDEPEILNKLSSLDKQIKENGENIGGSIDEIKNAIGLRSIKIRSKKRGSY